MGTNEAGHFGHHKEKVSFSGTTTNGEGFCQRISFGVNYPHEFLKEHNLYGGNHAALTGSEARTLLRNKNLDEARDRILEAIQSEDRGGLSSSVQEAPGSREQVSKPLSVSKVVDENGEPMVVYHGTCSGSRRPSAQACARTK